MKIPQYLFDRLNLIRSPKKAGRALRHYSKRLDQMGILPGTKLFHYFREGRFFFCPCDLDFVVNLRGDCSITFVFSMHRDPHGSSLDDLVRVRACFQGVKDIQCTLNECKVAQYRDYVDCAFWRSGRKTYIAITLTSGRNEDSLVAFSFKSVSFTEIEEKP